MPRKIDDIAISVYPAFAMLAAIKLDLFTHLSDGPKTAGDLASCVGANAKKLEQLLYVLVESELLFFRDGRFSNSQESEKFLSQSSLTYMSGRAQYYSDRWREALQSAESITTGRAQCKIDYSAMSHQKLESFLRGLLPVTIEEGRRLAAQFNLSQYSSLLDVGGGSGGLSIGLVQAMPSLNATVTDLPNVIPICKLLLDEQGMRQRVSVISNDITKEAPDKRYDVAVLKDFVQVLPEDKAEAAISNVYSALAPGGMIIIIGHITDDSRLCPREAALFNLVYLNIYDEGGTYPDSKYRKWIEDAGFVEYSRTVGDTGISTITARKLLE